MYEEPNISELCRAIKNTVTRAVHSNEMQELKQAMRDITVEITQKVKHSVSDAASSIPPVSSAPPPPPQEQREQQQEQPVYKGKPYKDYSSYKPRHKEKTYVYDTPAPSVPMVVNKNMRKMRFRSGVSTFFGVVGLTFSVGVTAILAAVTPLIPDLSIGLAVGAFALIPVGGCVAFGAMTRRGIVNIGLADRFEKYREVIGDDRLCPLQLLAEAVDKPMKLVRKDITRLIRRGFFPQGKLDNDKTTLILDANTYMQYLEAMKKSKNAKVVKPVEVAEKAQPAKAEPAPKASDRSPELEAALADGQTYIQRMRAANNLIDGEEISRKIDRMEQVSAKIFYYVEQNPQKLSEIRRFMSYYLPTTLKLLEAYCRFDAQAVQGDNIRVAKQEIEETLDTIILAFEKLLDGLFEAEAWDIATDISALEAMLTQEGLTGSDFAPKQ